MKKLMTMIAAVAMAFGLKADDAGFISGAGFDSNDEAANYSWVADGGFKAAYWGTIDEGVMTLNTDSDSQCKFQKADRPAQFDEGEQDGFMVIKTTLGNPVAQKIKTTGSYEIDDNLYFDGLVKFTAFDNGDAPAIADYDGAKIAVYPMLESEDDGADAKLYIQAGYAAALKTAKVIDDAWHRLTIKMIENIYTTGSAVGFVVFIDGKAVTCADSQTGITVANLKPEAAEWYNKEALILSKTASTEITDVAFDGQGSIDEIAFTTVAPTFAADGTYFEVKWNKDTVASMKINGETVDNTGSAYVMVTNNAGDAQYPIAYSWTGDATHMNGDGSFTSEADSFDLTAATSAKAVALFGDKKFATLTGDDGAIKAANESEDDGTLTLLAEIDEDITIENENSQTITIDLNGKIVKAAETAAIIAGTDIVIVGAGEVNANDCDYAVAAASGNITINSSATFTGAVSTDAVIQDCMAKFDVANNGEEECALENIPSGKKWQKVESDQYWQLRDLATVDFSVSTGVNNTEIFSVEINGEDVEIDEIPETLTEGDTYEVTFVAAEGYKFKDDTLEEVFSGTAETTAISIVSVKETEVEATDITVTVTLGTGITSVTIGEQTVTESGDVILPAETASVSVELTADSEINIPVFYFQEGVTSPIKVNASFTLTSPADGDLYTFTAKDATEVSPDDAKATLEEKGVTKATTAKFPGESVKALAAWMEAKGMTDEAGISAINASAYVQASVDLDVDLITDATVAKANSNFTLTGSEMSFRVSLDDDWVTSDNVTKYVKVTSDLADWTKTTGIGVSALDGVVTVNGGENTAVFSKFEIPTDVTPAE